jgi:tetratricopeptide (TPR) repeat protein
VIEPLPPAIEGELEQVDFFIEQSLVEEASALLDDIGPTYAQHPAVLARRARLAGAPPGEAAPSENVPEPLGADDTGAVPGEPLGGDFARGPGSGYRPAVTPVAVVTGGGADLSTHRDLGIAYKEMGLFDPAIAEFAHLMEDPNSEVFALTMTGECHEAKGVPSEALLHYKKALNRPNIRDDEATTLYFQLGRVFQSLGDSGEALYFFEKVARRDPKFQDVSQRVATLRAQGVAPLDRAGSRAAGSERGRR